MILAGGFAHHPRAQYTDIYTVTTATANFNLFSVLGSPSGKRRILCTINSGVYCHASSTGVYGFYCNGFAAGTTLDLICTGYIIGAGGVGGNGSTGINDGGDNGYAGGPAMYADSNITVNTSGAGWVGGGGGGGGGSGNEYNGSWGGGGGGGGGRGYNNAAGGSGQGGGNNGSAGSVSSGGGGGSGAFGQYTGGSGGSVGAAGNAGSGGHQAGPGSGGAAGAAFVKNGCTHNNSGLTFYGTVS